MSRNTRVGLSDPGKMRRAHFAPVNARPETAMSACNPAGMAVDMLSRALAASRPLPRRAEA